MNSNIWISDRFTRKSLYNFWKELLSEKWAFLGLLLYQKMEEGIICVDLKESVQYRVYSEGEMPEGPEKQQIDHLQLSELEMEEIRGLSAIGSPESPLFPLILNKDHFLYFQKFWRYEQELLHEHLIPRVNADPQDISQSLITGGKVNDSQLLGVYFALINRFSLITGGPGTGKTSVIARIIVNLFINTIGDSPKIALAAPTGKAAARMIESLRSELHELQQSVGKDLDWDVINSSTPKESFTIHRLLEYNPSNNRCRRNQENPLQYDMIVIDEATMIDLPLMVQLFRAIPLTTRVILLGDRDQLSSVGVGSVFSDLVSRFHRGQYLQDELVPYQKRGGTIPQNLGEGETNAERSVLTLLDKTYRFKEDSKIYDACQAVKLGNPQRLEKILDDSTEASGEFFWQPNARSLPAMFDILKPRVIDHFQSMLTLPVDTDQQILSALESLKRISFLSPIKEGLGGVDSINHMIAHKLNSDFKKPTEFHGLPIMILVNDYQNNLFNGDIGLIIKKENQYYGCFPCVENGYRLIASNILPERQPAYCMTIHKSQGSEYDEVMLILPDYFSNMNRELLYTGLSRGKKKVSLIGKKEIILKALSRRTRAASALARSAS